MISISEEQGQLVLALIEAAGAGGLVRGQDWRVKASQLFDLETHLRQELEPKPPAPPKTEEKK